MQKKTLLTSLGLYLVSTLLTFGALAVLHPQGSISILPDQGSDQIADGEDQSALGLLLAIDPSEAANQVCPLNGKLYTQTEKNAWEKKRPLAVMIENSPDSRPQSGLGSADIVFEAIAEGGVTRFMAMFYCGVQKYDTTLAPIRSARTYFVDWASGFNKPLYVHVGGANVPGPSDALGQIADYGWNGENDLNQFSIGYPTFVRDYNRVPGKEIATEHTMVTSTEKLWQVGAKRGWTNMSPELKLGRTTIQPQDWQDGYTGWQFEDASGEKGSVTDISFEFWTGFSQYAVRWQYDSATNTYKRFMAGESHVDMNNDQQIAASNAIVLFAKETGPINEKKHMLYATTGTGKALVFKNGQAIEATWSKKDRTSELQFLVNGQELALNRGLTWISVVDVSTDVSY